MSFFNDVMFTYSSMKRGAQVERFNRMEGEEERGKGGEEDLGGGGRGRKGESSEGERRGDDKMENSRTYYMNSKKR